MKNKKVIIFGVSDFARLIKHYFDIDTNYQIEAFCIDDEYKNEDTFCGLPVIKYSEIGKYPPNEYSFFVAIGYSNLNAIRTEVYTRLKKLGYSFVSYISSYATILSKDIGENCMICENTTVEPFAKIGNNVFIWNGNCIAHQAIVEDNVFITSQVMICGYAKIGENSFIGVKSAITDKIEIGKNCIIGAGSLIKSSLSDNSVCITKETKKMKIDSKQYFKLGLKL